MHKTIRISKKSIFFFLVFLVIYCSHDTILFGTNADNRFITLRKAFPFAAIVLLLFLRQVFSISRPALVRALLVMLLPIASCFVNGEETNNYIYRLALMAAALLMVLSQDQETFYEDYNQILYVLAIWSLVTYSLMLLVPGIMTRLPAVRNTGGTVYHFAGLSLVNSELHYGIYRNSSIFREPGMFSVMLVFALLNEVVVLKKKRVRYLLVYTIATLTTYSTAGYIVVAMLFAHYLITEKRTKYRLPLIVLTVLGLAFMVTQTDLMSAEGVVFGKFRSGSNNYGSFVARLGSIVTSLIITLNNPLFGIGRYALYDVVLERYNNFYQQVYQAVDNTNTILIGFAAYGIAFGLLISWGCWRYVRKREANPAAALYLLLALVLSLSNEDMGQNIVFYYLIFDGLCIGSAKRPAPPAQNMMTAGGGAEAL